MEELQDPESKTEFLELCIFNLDQAEKIYRDDYRMEKSLTLGNEEMRTVLKEKRFQTYYEQVMHYLKEMKNRKTSEDGLEYFFSES